MTRAPYGQGSDSYSLLHGLIWTAHRRSGCAWKGRGLQLETLHKVVAAVCGSRALGLAQTGSLTHTAPVCTQSQCPVNPTAK